MYKENIFAITLLNVAWLLSQFHLLLARIISSKIIDSYLKQKNLSYQYFCVNVNWIWFSALIHKGFYYQ